MEKPVPAEVKAMKDDMTSNNAEGNDRSHSSRSSVSPQRRSTSPSRSPLSGERQSEIAPGFEINLQDARQVVPRSENLLSGDQFEDFEDPIFRVDFSMPYDMTSNNAEGNNRSHSSRSGVSPQRRSTSPVRSPLWWERQSEIAYGSQFDLQDARQVAPHPLPLSLGGEDQLSFAVPRSENLSSGGPFEDFEDPFFGVDFSMPVSSFSRTRSTSPNNRHYPIHRDENYDNPRSSSRRTSRRSRTRTSTDLPYETEPQSTPSYLSPRTLSSINPYHNRVPPWSPGYKHDHPTTGNPPYLSSFIPQNSNLLGFQSPHSLHQREEGRYSQHRARDVGSVQDPINAEEDHGVVLGVEVEVRQADERSGRRVKRKSPLPETSNQNGERRDEKRRRTRHRHHHRRDYYDDGVDGVDGDEREEEAEEKEENYSLKDESSVSEYGTEDLFETSPKTFDSTHDSGLGNAVPTDLDEERLLYPSKYARKLFELEHQIFANSFCGVREDAHVKVAHPPDLIGTRLPLDVPATSIRRPIIPRNGVLAFYTQLYMADRILHQEIGMAIPQKETYLPFHFLECRNIIQNVAENVELMQSARYCSSTISILVADDTRHNVARLRPVNCQVIFELANAFESCLNRLLWAWRYDSEYCSRIILQSHAFAGCKSILESLGIHKGSGWSPSQILRDAIHILDFGVLSYVGAHTNMTEGLGRPKVFHGCIPLPNLEPLESSIVFQSRRFLCLDKFLGHNKAWVCEVKNISMPRLEILPGVETELMYLSTDAETFADVWGPMWSRCNVSCPEEILHYCVGNGVVTPWKEEPGQVSHTPILDALAKELPKVACEVRTGERLCHWIPDRQSEDPQIMRDASDIPLSNNDILLIGARIHLEKNNLCHQNPNKVREKLRNTNCVQFSGTIKRNWVKESKTVLTQVGYSGVVLGGQANYKIRERTLKQTIVERWKNEPNKRNPLILQHKLAVEVSMCTWNARRQRLITILGSSTMLAYLKGLNISWVDPNCEAAFVATLRSSDSFAFGRLWESEIKWRDNMGDAISCCLDVLADTGYSENGLGAFWMSDDGSESLITLTQKTHSWAGFLKDTYDSCAMAVFSNVCLEMDDDRVRCCENLETPIPKLVENGLFSRSGPHCILETSFILNSDHCPDSITSRKYQQEDGSTVCYWNTRKLQTGTKLNFGQNGKIKVMGPLNRTQLIGTWSLSMFPGILDKFSQPGHHHELIYEPEPSFKPVDIFLINRDQEADYSLARDNDRSIHERREAHNKWEAEKVLRGIGHGHRHKRTSGHARGRRLGKENAVLP